MLGKFLGFKTTGVNKGSQLTTGVDVGNITAVETFTQGLVKKNATLPRGTSANAVMKLANMNGKLSTQAMLLAAQAREQGQMANTALAMHKTAVQHSQTMMTVEAGFQQSKSQHAQNVLSHRMQTGILQNTHQGQIDGYGNALSSAMQGFN